MRLAIVVESIPPYCGGGEQVAWIHAVEMAKQHEVSVVTFGQAYSESIRDGLKLYQLPRRAHNLASYSTCDRRLLNSCIDRIGPSIIHCHMPNVLSGCFRKGHRLVVSTIHDGVPENELCNVKHLSRAQWLKFRLVRGVNIRKSDAVTCVSCFSRDLMRSLYPKHAGKFSFIPNPIHERYFRPLDTRDDGYVLNFGRQIPLKMAALLEVARVMPGTRFVFVGTGEMAKDHGLPNVTFLGFSDIVDHHIDGARVCVFPSLSENFPLVGLEAMARGKPVIATKRGFSEYIEHMKNGFLLDSTGPAELKNAINLFTSNTDLCRSIGAEGRITAESYHPARVVKDYAQLYQHLLQNNGPAHRAMLR